MGSWGPGAAPGGEKPSKFDRDDVLYVTGSVLVVAGLAVDGPNGLVHALVAAGGFCLVMPALEIAAGFIRGLRK